MPETFNILLALSGWAAWLSKEIIAKLLSRSLARKGPLGVIEGRTRIVCDTATKDGHIVIVDYFGGMGNYPQYSDCRNFRLESECQFFNDTDTPVVYTGPELQLWGVEGLRLLFHNPQLWVLDPSGGGWQRNNAIVVPSHGVTSARLELPIAAYFGEAESEVLTTYGESVALLRLRSITGRAVTFRLCTSSFAGKHKVVWPSEKKYPVFNISALNVDGRNAGQRPQDRVPVRAPERTRSRD